MKYIIISKKHGVFIGTIMNIAVFSKTDLVITHKAYGFTDRISAEKYIETNFKSKDKEDFFVADINTKDDYVSCVDIIKSGYVEYVGSMINYMPMISESIH